MGRWGVQSGKVSGGVVRMEPRNSIAGRGVSRGRGRTQGSVAAEAGGGQIPLKVA